MEAETIGGGITKNTTAKITSQHGLIYDKLIRNLELARPNSTLMPMKRPFRSTGSCAAAWTATLKKKTAYVYSLNDRRKIERELDALEKLGVPWGIYRPPPLPSLWPEQFDIQTRPSFIR